MDCVLAADLSTFMRHSAYCVKLQQLVVLWWWLNLFIQWDFVHAELHITDLQKKIWQNIGNILRGKKAQFQWPKQVVWSWQQDTFHSPA